MEALFAYIQATLHRKGHRMSINPPMPFNALTTPFNRLAIGTVVENIDGIRYMKTYCDGFELWVNSTNIEIAHDSTKMLTRIQKKPEAWLVWV